MRRVRDDKEIEVLGGRRPDTELEVQETRGTWTGGVHILGLSNTKTKTLRTLNGLRGWHVIVGSSGSQVVDLDLLSITYLKYRGQRQNPWPLLLLDAVYRES